MTQEEKTEMAAIFSTAAKLKDAEYEATTLLIDYKLKTILEQTTKHNTHMDTLDKRCEDLEIHEAARASTCPQAENVRALQDGALSTKSIKKWIIGSVLSTGGVVSILWMLWAVFGDKI